MAEEAKIQAAGDQKGRLVGNRDPRVHRSRLFWLSDGITTVCGVYGPGTSQELAANWSMPLQGMTPAKAVGDAASGLAQAATGLTMVKDINTLQVWSGNEPYALSVEARFYALSDPDLEVMQPLRALEWFIAPDVKEFIGGPGKIAPKLTLNLGTKIIWNNLVLKNVSIPFDKETDSQGRFVRATATLSLSSHMTPSRSKLKSGYGLRSGFVYK